jgi:hypothetical protein
MSIARIALALVGIVAIGLALVGCAYNALTLSADFSQLNDPDVERFFYPAFYTMTAVCIGCYLLLFYIGVQMVRGKTSVTRLLVLLLVFEVLYFFTIGFLWMTPDYGTSIAAATGVANGGLMFQVFALFPFWAPVVAFLASRSLDETRKVPSADP